MTDPRNKTNPPMFTLVRTTAIIHHHPDPLTTVTITQLQAEKKRLRAELRVIRAEIKAGIRPTRQALIRADIAAALA